MSQLFAQVAKVLECFSISPSNDYSGLISFRMDWLDLLAVQGTLKSLIQQQFQTYYQIKQNHELVNLQMVINRTKLSWQAGFASKLKINWLRGQT